MFGQPTLDPASNGQPILHRASDGQPTLDRASDGQPILDPASDHPDRYFVDFLSFYLTGVRETLKVQEYI